MIPPAVQAKIDAIRYTGSLGALVGDFEALIEFSVRETARECAADLHDRASLLDPDSAPCNRYARTKLINAAEGFRAKYGVTP